MSKAFVVALALITVIGSGLFFATAVRAQNISVENSQLIAQTTTPQKTSNPTPGSGSVKKLVPKEISDLREGINVAENEGKNNLAKLANDDLGFKLASLSCIMSSEISDCSDPKNPTAGILETGATLIGGIYSSPPASTQTYVAYVMDGMRLGAPAYAQGIGFSALSPVLSVWVVMRNLAYFFFIAAFIFMGFAIMTNGKFLTKQAITIQQAIPTIIIALITVTFSYAIAGLLIDGMYLVMFLLAGLFGKIDLIDGNVFQMTGRLIGSDVAGSSGRALGELIEAAIGGGVFGTIAGVVTNIGATVIILLVLVFNTFKLFFNLLKVYIELIISIAFAPVILMMGAIPGQNPFAQWLKDIVGNLAVFPAILLMLIMFDVIRDSTSQVEGGFLPPYLAGYTDASVLPLLAGLALVLALPQVVDEVRKAFGVSQGGFFGNLVQAGMKNAQQYRGVGVGVAGALTGGVAGAGAGALIGGLRGGGSMTERLTRARKGAVRGGVIGGITGPAIATGLPLRLARTIGSETINATAAITAGEAMDNVLDRFDTEGKIPRTRDRWNRKGTPAPSSRAGKTTLGP